MPRIRTIKPEFPQSESVGRLSRDARLLFFQLWTISDDEGRMRAATPLLVGQLYPYDKDAMVHIEEWIGECERERCIRRYQVNGATYLQITNWHKHQRIDKPTPSKLPPPPDDPERVHDESRAGQEGSRNAREESRGLTVGSGSGSGRDQDPDRDGKGGDQGRKTTKPQNARPPAMEPKAGRARSPEENRQLGAMAAAGTVLAQLKAAKQ